MLLRKDLKILFDKTIEYKNINLLKDFKLINITVIVNIVTELAINKDMNA